MDHLVEAVRRWPALRSIKLEGDDSFSTGPDAEEVLQEQHELLSRALKARPCLQEVVFQVAVVWRMNSKGHWTAVYTGTSVLDRRRFFCPP